MIANILWELINNPLLLILFASAGAYVVREIICGVLGLNVE